MDSHGEHLRHVEHMVAQHVLERAARCILEHEVIAAVVGDARIVGGENVGVARQRGHGTRLRAEGVCDSAVHLLDAHFDGDVAFYALLPVEVDGSGGTVPEHAHIAVAGKARWLGHLLGHGGSFAGCVPVSGILPYVDYRNLRSTACA